MWTIGSDDGSRCAAPAEARVYGAVSPGALVGQPAEVAAVRASARAGPEVASQCAQMTLAFHEAGRDGFVRMLR